MSVRTANRVPWAVGLLLIGIVETAVWGQSSGRARPLPLADLQSRLSHFTGRSPVVCGRYLWNGSNNPRSSIEAVQTSLACGLSSVEAKTPFWIVWGGPGFDSWVAHGVFGDQTGRLYAFRYDNDPSGGSGSAARFTVSRCVKPAVKLHGDFDDQRPAGNRWPGKDPPPPLIGTADIVCAEERTLAGSSIASYVSIVLEDLMVRVRRLIPW